MRTSAVALAVASVLGAAAASAANVEIYISGASAQRTFWIKDLTNICGTTAVNVQEFDGNLAQSPNPDYKAWRCTGSGTALSPVHSGDQVTMHYSAELGSEWGIAPGLGNAGISGYPTTHIFLDPGTVANCTVKTAATTTAGTIWNCPGTSTGSTYNYVTDAVSGAPAGLFAQHTPDIVAADIEPTKWANSDNWAGTGGAGISLGGSTVIATSLGKVPTAKALGTLQLKGNNIAGQIFSIILNNGTNTAAVPGGLTNLSHQSLQSIFQGVYTTWNQVPEVGAADSAGTTINVCRRDHGSGTQTSASLLFTGTECNLPNTHAFVSKADANFMDTSNVIENNTTSLMQACVTGNPAAIGFATLAPSGSYTTISIDGVAPNAHNAAGGYYPFAYETWAWNVTNNALATLFLNRAKDDATISSVAGAETVKLQANGQFTVSTGNPVGYYALSINNASTNSVAGLTNGATTTTAASGVPTEIFAKGGESCTAVGNGNSD